MKGSLYDTISIMKEETKRWIAQAENDYDMMELSWENRKYAYTILFAQQALEKIIKAYIIENQSVAPRKIHHIEKLLIDADLDTEEMGNPPVEELSKGYTRVRYPDMSKKYYESQLEVEPIIVMARRLYKWIKQKLKQNSIST